MLSKLSHICKYMATIVAIVLADIESFVRISDQNLFHNRIEFSFFSESHRYKLLNEIIVRLNFTLKLKINF
jgi:hypothetical protein